jgi:protein-disulfide isomerase
MTRYFNHFSKVLLTLIFTVISIACSPAQAATTPAQLYYPSLNTVAGNPNGRITVVEFFDYRCKYCRQMPAVLAQLQRTNPGVRIVYRDYPLLGPVSVYAAQTAVAAKLQNKYIQVHNALYSGKRMTNDQVIAIARAQGVDVNRLIQDMNSSQVTNQLQETSALAQQLEVDGVPTFFVGITPSSVHSGPISAFEFVSPEASDLRGAIAKLTPGSTK